MIGNHKNRQQIGKRNGLKIYKGLKTKTKLKTRTKIKPKTQIQIKIDKEWSKITNAKIKELNYTCQWCGQHGNRTGWNFLSGHHIIKRRFNIHTIENCYVCHYISCHSFIENNSIDVRIYPNKIAWEKRNE